MWISLIILMKSRMILPSFFGGYKDQGFQHVDINFCPHPYPGPKYIGVYVGAACSWKLSHRGQQYDNLTMVVGFLEGMLVFLFR